MRLRVLSMSATCLVVVTAPAVADACNVEAGVFKFREYSGQALWRVQNFASGSASATTTATWDLVGSPWGNVAGGHAEAAALSGMVIAAARAQSNALGGGSVGVGSAATDDLIIRRRDGQPGDGIVIGSLRVTLDFQVSMSLANLQQWNRDFNASRVEWQISVRDAFEHTFSGWITRNPDGVFSSGSQTLGKQTFDVPFAFTVDTPLGLVLGVNLDTQVLGNSDQTANVSVNGNASLELGEVQQAAVSGGRLAVVLPPEYRADSVKWNIVDGVYTPPGATPCAADLDGSRVVDPADIGLLLLDFGSCPGCASDLDGSGETDSADLGLILLEFGDCP